MNVRYQGRITEDTFGEKLSRPIEPAAIVSFREDEEPVAIAILDSTGYDYDVFGEQDMLWAEVPVDNKADYQDFMREWKEGKEAYNL